MRAEGGPGRPVPAGGTLGGQAPMPHRVSSPLILGPAACSGPGSAPQWWVGQWAAVDRAPIDTTGPVASGRVPIHPIHDPVQGNVTSPLLVHPLLRADSNTRGEPQTGRPFTHCIALRASPAAIPPPLCAELGKWFLGFWCFSFSFLFFCWGSACAGSTVSLCLCLCWPGCVA